MAPTTSQWLVQSLGYEFNDDRLLQQALTHRSSARKNNERLEFLGDAVLDAVISEMVYRSQPDAPEGDLSRLRASLVKSTSLAELANGLGLGSHLILGGGEQKAGGHRRESILADALEALIGAVYLDAGFEATAALIGRIYAERMQNLPPPESLRDPKTRLQEFLQARGAGLPEYELLNVSGKAHQQRFEVSCSIFDGEQRATGTGSSRRSAEQQSARRLLQELGAEVTRA